MASRKRSLSSRRKSRSETLSLKESTSTANQVHTASHCIVKLENVSNLETDRTLAFKKPPALDSSLNVITSKEIPPFKARKSLDFEEKLDQFIGHPLIHASCKGRDNLSKPDSFSWNAVDNINSVIDKVRNLQLLPSVYVYTVASEKHGISAIDIDQNRSHLAFSPANSCEIHLLTWDDHSNDYSGNVNDVWFKYVATKNLENNSKKRKMTKNSQSPQIHRIQHAATVTGLRFTTDGNLLLSGSLDGSVKVYSTNNYCVVECYNGFGCISDIDVSSDSTHFVTVNGLTRFFCSESIASLYSFENTEPVMSFLGHKDAIKCVRFHPNGLYIATASSDKTIKLWNTRTSRELRNFEDKSFGGSPEKLAFSPDGKYLASTYSGSVKIWDLATGKIVKSLETSNSEPNNLCICYNSSGNILAAGGSDGKLYMWNIKSDKSSAANPEIDLLKCTSLGKRIHSIKYTSNFFSCVTT